MGAELPQSGKEVSTRRASLVPAELDGSCHPTASHGKINPKCGPFQRGLVAPLGGTLTWGSGQDRTAALRADPPHVQPEQGPEGMGTAGNR